MSAPRDENIRVRALRRDLDQAAERAAGEMLEARVTERVQGALAGALPALAAIPGLYLLAEFGQWTKDGPAFGISLVLVALVALAVPPLWAWTQARKERSKGVSRGAALGAIDEHLGLEGRLLAADEFLAMEERGPFHEAAIEDAGRRAHAAVINGLDLEVEQADLRRDASRWSLAGAALLIAAGLVAGLERFPALGSGDDLVAAASGTAAGDAAVEALPEGVDAPPEVAQPELPEISPDERRQGEGGREAQDSVDISGEAKESAGKTGAGQSSGALSSSAASESKSAPSSQGKSSTPSKPQAKKPTEKKKPKDTGAEPEPQERQEDEQSGSTAGKGSSKGSNKNPTASDWKSRDQVTETDDQEIEDDEETDDDEEEQENRGGVQPSLRDRRPPVSRDLQIGFGNRPNPDANGRGGPSEQKKSRGVASLVLGVPIPDRIKGRPGPGPTKITQERIEPEAEEAAPVGASPRAPRVGSLERPSSLRLDPSLRALVRDYFLALRAEASGR